MCQNSADAVELVPVCARFVLGRTLQRLGRLAEALTQMRMASAMNPVPEYLEAIAEVTARITLQDR